MPETHRTRCRVISLCIFFALIIGWFFLSGPPAAWGATAAEPYTDSAVAARGAFSPEQYLNNMKDALVGQRMELVKLRSRLAELEQFGTTLQYQIQLYESEMTALDQLLLMSQPAIDELERALRSNRGFHQKLIQQTETLQAQYDESTILFIKTNQIKLLTKQLSGLMRTGVTEAEEQALETTANELINVLKEKKELGDSYHQLYDELHDGLKQSLEKNETIDETLAERMQSELDRWFYTPSRTYRQLFSKAFPESLAEFIKRITPVFKASTWHSLWDQIKTNGFQPWGGLLFWLSLVIWQHLYFKTKLKRFEAAHETPQWHYRCLIIFLLRRSLLYLGLTILFGIYDNMVLSPLDIGLSRLLFLTFLTLLITRWGFDFYKYQPKASPTPLQSFVSTQIKQFLRLWRVLFIGSILVLWIAGRDNLLASLVREIAIAVVFAWTVIFWRRLKPFLLESRSKGIAAPDSRWMGLFRIWSYLVSGGGIVLSLAGYKVIGGFWITGWIKSVAILFWGWFSLKALREWQRAQAGVRATADEASWQVESHNLGWALLQLGLAVWLLAMALGMIWAWDNGGLMVRVKSIFALTYTIGSLNFSIRDIMNTVAILFLTRIIVNTGRTLLDMKILANKNLEPGVKHSINTGISYCGWGLGLLMALSSIGVDATSLAVVFGALSVGIGFGLQTIVNNFISGLILLFERPIQVGDTIEINGIWAEVKKINVRATVVQTFDNASVIIPNSEFISQRVTNWSFKDRRMRTSMEIGVAYGSDLDLVAQTLSDIANSFRDVLKYPKPQVLFIDHGDSALIFRLRFWIRVEDILTVPSRIRFEIDKRFRELSIDIPLPQRDLHIRTMPACLSAKTDDQADHSN